MDVLEFLGFPGGSNGKESTCNAGDLGSIPRLGRSCGEENGNTFQYSFLENSMGRGAWAMVHGLAKSQTQVNNEHTSYWCHLTHSFIICPISCK